MENKTAISWMKSMCIIYTSFIFLFFTSLSFGGDFDSSRKADRKAKYRLYPGGRDEEDLKVQTQLPGPGKRLPLENKTEQESD